MRYAIWKKDDFFAVGNKRVDMDPSVVQLPEEAPLSWMFEWNDAAGKYGRVTEIRLEDGEITGELFVMDPTFNPVLMEEQNIRLGGYYSDVVYNEDRTQVASCTLRGVSIIMRPYGVFPKED